jgi:Zinc finger, ZZ type
MRDLSEVLAASPQSAATSLCTRISDAQHQFNEGAIKDEEMQDVSTAGEKAHDSQEMVEYQCDSCHTIILDNRWHCNECADYDLCDKCMSFIPGFLSHLLTVAF